MTRDAYDTVGGKAIWVHQNLPLPDVMFWYGTGSPDVQWTDQERALFPVNILAEIDQGGRGTPVLTATVRDVENGAWGPLQAVNKTGWDVARPTLYGSRDTLASCHADGWQGDFWLAWPGWKGEVLPSYPGISIIGVQDEFNANYDHTTLLDASWPHKPIVPIPENQLSITVESRMAHMFFTSAINPDVVNVLYSPTPGADPVLLQRIIGVQAGMPQHVNNLVIPGHAGGIVIVTSVKNGVTTEIGAKAL